MIGALLVNIIPVFFIVLVGFVAERRLALGVDSLSRFALYVLVSALIFDSLYRSDVTLASAAGLCLGFVLTTALLAAIAWPAIRAARFTARARASLMTSALFSNSGNMGLPVVLFALGPAALDRAVVYLLIASVVLFIVGPALFRATGLRESVRLTLGLPFLWAGLVALAFRAFDWHLPLRLDDAVHMLGQAAIPVELLVLGMQIARTRLRLGLFVTIAGGLRLLAGPALAGVVALGLGLSPLDARVLVLLSAMPTAVNALLLSIEFGGDAERTAEAVMASTVFSFLTLPLVLAALPYLG